MDPDQNLKSLSYVRNHVEFTCTDDQKDRLERELKATGRVVDIKIVSKSDTEQKVKPQHESIQLKGI